MAGQTPGGQTTPPNINSLAAQGIQGAGMGTALGMGYTPSQVGVVGQSASVTPTNVAGTNVTGTNVTGSNVTPMGLSNTVTPNQLANTSLAPYMNPYTQNVIDAQQADLLRGANIGLNQLGAQAQAAGGFGGSRHGIAMSEMGRGVADIMGQQSAGLRQAGYQNAQQAAMQDIQNNMQGQLANQAGSQFDISTGMQGQLSNQQNNLQAQLANQQVGLQAGLANQNVGMQGQLANQQAGMQGQLANQAAGQQDIRNELQASLANQQAGLAGQQQRLGAAGQLGNIANLGFGMGQTVNKNLAMQGAQQQAMQQALFEAAQAEFRGFKGHPAAGIGYVNSALGNTPNVGTVSTNERKNLGLFDYLTAMSGAYTGGN